MFTQIAPYITVLTAIIAAYLTYRSQLRLKTFEMLVERRNAVLLDIEKFIGELYDANYEAVGEEVTLASKKYSREYFHEALILMHKIKGANFGSSVDVLNKTFWQIITKPGYGEAVMSKEQFKDWVSRTTNVVSLIYGLAHSELTKELEKMALPWLSRKLKAYQNRKAIQR
ncbi:MULTISPECIES: hypothetical protein [Pseudomonas]|uniref:DUF4760 domain-containing protein n=1 Tax=Pseudomonas aphyarum TaxID=2942629 RepID=A0ABT5PHA2_9PSED|nr:hypothetical protein [Pseudomonas aphyarum]MDD0967932.1 hypothetical protein [Pseudomonas aphyarum]MDD1123243.1 hypothetical protein [Pseudomonas aphyarum]